MTSSSTKQSPEKQLKAHAAALQSVRSEIGRVVFGQDDVVERTLITMICGGHVLLVGVPGLAKTLLVETIADVLGLSSNRIQCTPDLMPADILGSEILEESESGKRSFRFIKGPIFTQFLMADEINRASPRTQSALLQAMQEHEVSIAGKAHKLPAPFHVLATQNPIEQEGTYPLPEAQLDRFMMQIDVDYPDSETERKILMSTTGNESAKPKQILKKNDLSTLQAFVRDMPIGDSVVDAILSLVRRARPGLDAHDIVNDFVNWAPGPRASQSLMLAVRAKALIDGREAPSIDDVVDLAVPILQHRMALNYKAQGAGVTKQSLIKTLCAEL